MSNILTVPMQNNDAGAATVGEYLIKLLADVWKYDEGFDGKRPFGNSGWKYEVDAALVSAGAVRGNLDEDGYLDDCDDDQADLLVSAAIASMGGE